MTKIPIQLWNKDFRFIKIHAKDKRPIEKDWQNTNNYIYSDIELTNWLNNNNNYGIVCGKGNLAVIDCDEKEIEDIVEKNLPKTFAVQTGSGGKHYYFIIRDMKKTVVLQKPIKDNTNKIIDKKHCGEIRSTNSQIVAPNSIHPNGNTYKVILNNDIAEIHKATIDYLFNDYIENEKDNDHINKQNNLTMKYNVDIRKFIDVSNFKKIGNEYQGPHPIHGSTTGMNFSINTNNNLWHCFRCRTGGGVVSLIAMLNGIILCSSARNGCITPTIFNDVKKIAKEKYNIIIEDKDANQ